MPIETPDSTLVVMLGTNSSYLSNDRYSWGLSLTDDDNSNSFIISGSNSEIPCDPFHAATTGRRLPEGTKSPSTFKFTFLPRESFGYCETPQAGGYINVGKYTYPLNLDEPLHLQVSSTSKEQEVYITYLSIEST